MSFVQKCMPRCMLEQDKPCKHLILIQYSIAWSRRVSFPTEVSWVERQAHWPLHSFDCRMDGYALVLYLCFSTWCRGSHRSDGYDYVLDTKALKRETIRSRES